MVCALIYVSHAIHFEVVFSTEGGIKILGFLVRDFWI